MTTAKELARLSSGDWDQGLVTSKQHPPRSHTEMKRVKVKGQCCLHRKNEMGHKGRKREIQSVNSHHWLHEGVSKGNSGNPESAQKTGFPRLSYKRSQLVNKV